MNKFFSIYHTSWITNGLKNNFICDNIPTKAILVFVGCSEVNSTWLITSKLANQRARKVLFTCVVSEAYHLEAINSDPMLGFFSEPIKIYFLIWSVAHFMSRYRRLCGSYGGHGCSFRVDQLVCRFSTFFALIKEIKRFFLELLVQYQACRLLKSSIAGKHFFVSKQVWIWLTIFWSFAGRQGSVYWLFLHGNLVRFSSILRKVWDSHRFEITGFKRSKSDLKLGLFRELSYILGSVIPRGCDSCSYF